MDEKTYFKVIDELSRMKFAGRIGLHHYGEPLLDKRLAKLIEYARQKCKNSFIEFASNGDFLTKESLENLIDAGLNRINLTYYDDEENADLLKLVKKYRKIIKYRHYRNMLILNRAGSLFNYSSKMANNACFRPKYQLIINWKGDVILCCNDYYSDFIFGNVKDNTIWNIWYSHYFTKIRAILSKKKGRSQIKMCKKCDSPSPKQNILNYVISAFQNKINKYLKKS